jgi:hypothetical protein
VPAVVIESESMQQPRTGRQFFLPPIVEFRLEQILGVILHFRIL